MMHPSLVALLALLLAASTSACSGGDGRAPGMSDTVDEIPTDSDESDAGAQDTPESDGAAGPADLASSPCPTDWEIRDCTIDLGIIDGTHHCSAGFQICDKGKWSRCVQFKDHLPTQQRGSS